MLFPLWNCSGPRASEIALTGYAKPGILFYLRWFTIRTTRASVSVIPIIQSKVRNMAKRFTDTAKYKKTFIRSLPGAYKLLWDFLYHDCDHAGIWIVDFDIAQTYLGRDMPVDKEKALQLFNADEVRIIEIDGGKKWFIKSFIEFQYGKLSEKNKAHTYVISVLQKYNLIDDHFLIKPLASPLQGAKEKDKEKEKEIEEENKGGVGEKEETPIDVSFDDKEQHAAKFIIPQMLSVFCLVNKNYLKEPDRDYPELLKIANSLNRQNITLNDEAANKTLLQRWKSIVDFIAQHSFYRDYSIKQINTHIQSILQAKNNGTTKPNRQHEGYVQPAVIEPNSFFGRTKRTVNSS